MGTVKSCTLGRDSGHWHISFQMEIEVAESPRHPATSTVGLDMGVAHFAVDSNGTSYAGRNSFRQLEQRIAAAQRRLKRKFSQNWKKQKARITRLHQKAANVRRDTLHKLSTAISNNHAMVAVEELRVRNMSASAKGTLAAQGKQVKQKAGLNKAILDQGWFEFRRQLSYKQTWRGGLLIAVPAHHTSQTCPNAATFMRTIAKPALSSRVWPATTRLTPMWWGPGTCWLGHMSSYQGRICPLRL